MSPVVGKPIDRVDGRLKVTGGAKYAADFRPGRVAEAVLLQSTIARGRIVSRRIRRARTCKTIPSPLSHAAAAP
ncbi:MAG TPA: hypothetical protein VGL03_04305 [Thermoanaerobaculia bacterium]|jgi:xanthine dehydrogenase YagR molybdenum-binding subunit